VKATRAGAITISDVGANGMQFGFRAVNGAAMGATFDGSEVAKCVRWFSVHGSKETGPKVRE
jgi:hypothetical protein